MSTPAQALDALRSAQETALRAAVNRKLPSDHRALMAALSLDVARLMKRYARDLRRLELLS